MLAKPKDCDFLVYYEKCSCGCEDLTQEDGMTVCWDCGSPLKIKKIVIGDVSNDESRCCKVNE